MNSPEDEATQDERIKRLPSDTELFLALAPEVQALFGPPPLIPWRGCAGLRDPPPGGGAGGRAEGRDEWLYVKDVADFTWAEQRLRRLQTRLLCKEIRSGLRDHLETGLPATGKKDAAKTQETRRRGDKERAYITNDQEMIAASRQGPARARRSESMASKALVKVLDIYGPWSAW